MDETIRQASEPAETPDVPPAAEKPQLPVITFRDGREKGYLSVSALWQKHLVPGGSPVAVARSGGRRVKLYDVKEAHEAGDKEEAEHRVVQHRRCTVCGSMTSSETGVCHKCTQTRKAAAEHDLYEAEKRRAASLDPRKMVFLDLEMTGDSHADEILSVSMTDGLGNVLLDTLIRPKIAKRWPFTVKIHHITPKMVKDKPTIDEVEGRIYEILTGADEILGYSISNDWKYLRALPTVVPIAEELHTRVRCCQMFYDHFIKSDMPALENGKRSLINAMMTLGLDWDGEQHSSLADTLACMRVWRRLFLESDKISVPVAEYSDSE